MTTRKVTSKKTSSTTNADEVITPASVDAAVISQIDTPRKRRGRVPGSSHTEDSVNEESTLQPPPLVNTSATTTGLSFVTDADVSTSFVPPQTTVDSQVLQSSSKSDSFSLNQANLTSLMMDANIPSVNDGFGNKKEEIKPRLSSSFGEHDNKNEKVGDIKKKNGIRRVDIDSNDEINDKKRDKEDVIGNRKDKPQNKSVEHDKNPKRGISNVEGPKKDQKQTKKNKNGMYVYHGTVINKNEGNPHAIVLVSNNILKAYAIVMKECKEKWGKKTVDRNGVDLSLAHSALSVQFVSDSNHTVYFDDKDTTKYLSGDTNNSHFYTFVAHPSSSSSSSSSSDKSDNNKNNTNDESKNHKKPDNIGCYVVSAPDKSGALALIKKYCLRFDDLNNPSVLSEMTANLKEIDKKTSEIAYLSC